MLTVVFILGLISASVSEDVIDLNTTVANNSHLLPQPPVCGIQVVDRIVGGTATALGEFPWLALLQYEDTDGDVSFLCGGALISSRYVLSASHCIFDDDDQKLVSVRLGEWDQDAEEDCIVVRRFKDCSDPPLDIRIEKIITHAKYKEAPGKLANDIALLRLKDEVEFTQFINPICLPLPTMELTPGVLAWVSGWGRTEVSRSSNIKLKVQLPIVSLEECKTTYARGRVPILDTQVCAGGQLLKDSCSGDSGGPLMMKYKGGVEYWILHGIVSFGPSKCGSQDLPGIYTNVAHYIDWIYEHIQP